MISQINNNFLQNKLNLYNIQNKSNVLCMSLEKRKTSRSFSVIVENKNLSSIQKELEMFENMFNPHINISDENENILFSIYFNMKMFNQQSTKFILWQNKLKSILIQIQKDFNINLSKIINNLIILTNTQGGGFNSQYNASCLSINYSIFKLLLNYFNNKEENIKLKRIFKTNNLLTRDIRQEESKKYGKTKARRPQQWKMR